MHKPGHCISLLFLSSARKSFRGTPNIDHDLKTNYIVLFRMRLINVEAFLGREELIKSGKELNRRTSVFAFRDDEATDYAILSHRWMSMEHEVDYDEMNDLAKMDKGEIAEVCRRDGYRKILDSCEQAKRDRYKWLWIDTCCIDKRSSAELSEAINSMFRWYENSRVCYAYFHDLTGKSFPTARDVERYPNFNGWPEWFSRGWTLQEMIAPSDVRFFNKNWQPIGDKMTLAHTLAEITRVPEDILRYGLPVIRPCVAQILSWAADRVTTRVEDRAYSLLGLLDVNMPMLYGEGKKAFRRLQLEIIRISNDQSIFAWDYQGEKGRTCSILADDPSFFRNCSEMELIHDLDKFKQMHKNDMEEPPSKDINDDQFGVFPITNRGIQILLLLRCLDDFDSVFEARLPCCSSPSGPSVTIKLISSKRNYYRHFTSVESEVSRERTLRFKNVTLRYQDMLCSATFEIDDNGMTKRGFNYCGTYRASRLAEKLAEKTIMLTNTDPLCVEVYSDHQANLHLAVGYGEFFGQHWIHLNCEVSAGQSSWKDYAEEQYMKMLDSGQTYAKHMIDACPRNERYHRLLVKHTSLPGSARTVQTCCVTWKSSKTCTVKINVFHGFCRVPVNKWVGFDTDVGGFMHVCAIMSSLILLLLYRELGPIVTCNLL